MSRLTRLPAPVLAAALVFGFAWCLLASGAMRAAARPDPHMSGTSVNQLKLELAGTSKRATKLLIRWGEQSTERIRAVIYLDFDFIPAYVLLLGSLAILAGSTSSPDTRLSAGLLLGMILAGGILDAIENTAMLAWLSDQTPAWAPGLTLVVAVAKWELLLLATGASIVKLVRSALVRAVPAPASPAPGS